MSRLPRLQPCQVSALQIGDDLIRNTAINVRFLGHFGFPSLCWPWVASADATLAFAENGVCKPHEQNAERGINGGDPPLRGGGRLCRESPILFLRRAEGLAPKQGPRGGRKKLAASAADDARYGIVTRMGHDAFLRHGALAPRARPRTFARERLPLGSGA